MKAKLKGKAMQAMRMKAKLKDKAMEATPVKPAEVVGKAMDAMPAKPAEVARGKARKAVKAKLKGKAMKAMPAKPAEVVGDAVEAMPAKPAEAAEAASAMETVTAQMTPAEKAVYDALGWCPGVPEVIKLLSVKVQMAKDADAGDAANEIDDDDMCKCELCLRERDTARQHSIWQRAMQSMEATDEGCVQS